MLSKLAKKAKRRVRALMQRGGRHPSFVLHDYRKPDGSFDYEGYRAIQVAANKRKLDNVWVQRENIDCLAAYIRSRVANPTVGLCHGTRRGLEQQWFSEALGCPVIGTEISDTAAQFPHTIQHDFHEPLPRWQGAADFIYSNSFDHAYDPEKALTNWVACLKPGGMVLLEHTSRHGASGADKTDPFGADLEVLPYLILRWGRGRYFVTDLLDLPKAPSAGVTMLKAVVIEARGP